MGDKKFNQELITTISNNVTDDVKWIVWEKSRMNSAEEAQVKLIITVRERLIQWGKLSNTDQSCNEYSPADFAKANRLVNVQELRWGDSDLKLEKLKTLAIYLNQIRKCLESKAAEQLVNAFLTEKK